MQMPSKHANHGLLCLVFFGPKALQLQDPRSPKFVGVRIICKLQCLEVNSRGRRPIAVNADRLWRVEGRASVSTGLGGTPNIYPGGTALHDCCKYG